VKIFSPPISYCFGGLRPWAPPGLRAAGSSATCIASRHRRWRTHHTATRPFVLKKRQTKPFLTLFWASPVLLFPHISPFPTPNDAWAPRGLRAGLLGSGLGSSWAPGPPHRPPTALAASGRRTHVEMRGLSCEMGHFGSEMAILAQKWTWNGSVHGFVRRFLHLPKGIERRWRHARGVWWCSSVAQDPTTREEWRDPDGRPLLLRTGRSPIWITRILLR